MKQFDYNKYLKNNPLLKEADEKAPWEKFRKPEDNPNTLLGLLQKQYPNFPFQKYRKKSGKYDIPMSVWNREVGLTPQELQKMAKQANAMGLADTWNIYGDPKRAGYMTIDINDPRRPMPSIHGTFWNPDADINERGIEETKKPMKEYDKDSGPQMEELLKMLKDLQEKNKEIKAVGTTTLEKMIADLEMEIRRLPNMDKNISQYNTNEGINNAREIETQLKATIAGQNDDMSFLDGITDREFVAALKNLGMKFKKSDSGMSMDYYIGRPGNGMMFSNEDGNWFAGDWATA